MKFYFTFSLFTLILACNPNHSNNTTSKLSDSSDPCSKYAETLNGAFAVSYMEGAMVWNGGLAGSVDIAGNDYNDMTCTYTVSDCIEGTVSMRCNTSLYDTRLIIYSRDSMLLGENVYTRVK